MLLNTPLTAPVKAGEQVGSVHYFLDGEEVAVSPVRAAADVDRADGIWYIKQIRKLFLLR